MARAFAVPTLLVLTTLVWGSAFTAIKKLVVVLGPIDLAFVRFALSAALFALLLWQRSRRAPLPVLTPREWGIVVLLGFFGVVGYHVALNGGEEILTRTASTDVAAILSSFLISLNPAFTLLLAAAIAAERITPRRALGVAVAFVGSALLILWGKGSLIPRDALVGALIVVVAPFSWAVYTLLMKRFLRGHDPLALTAYAMIAGTVLLLPFVSGHVGEDVRRLDAGLWGWMVVLSLGATFGGYLVWNYALSHWDASRVSAFVYLVPLFGLLVATLQAQERPTVPILVGGAIILAGLWYATAPARRPRPTPARRPRAAGPPEKAP